MGLLELVGTPTLRDTLRATRVHGVVCFTGMLSNQWVVGEFRPIEDLPRGVRLTADAGEARDLPADVFGVAGLPRLTCTGASAGRHWRGTVSCTRSDIVDSFSR